MAMDQLNEREKYILRERRLNEEPRTLASIGDEMALSKERVRQLEVSAFTKMRSALERQGVGVHDLVS